MRHKKLIGLIALNAILLTSLAMVSFTPQPAQAQLGARAGDYVMVSAQRRGKTWSTVYITDLNNGAILAVDPTPRKELEVVGFRAIGRDFEEGRAGR